MSAGLARTIITDERIYGLFLPANTQIVGVAMKANRERSYRVRVPVRTWRGRGLQ